MRNAPRATRLKRSTVFQGRVFTVAQDRVRLPNGRTVTMDVVHHRGSVVLVPQPSPDEVILIRQYRYVIDKWIWELPAGTLEVGEAPARAARRECAEEIGLSPRVIKRLGKFYPTPGFCNEDMVFYACLDLRTPKGPVAHDVDEHIEPKTFTLREAWALVASGDIVDMKTIVGLHLTSFPAGFAPPERPPALRRKRTAPIEP